ncbi:nucleotidyltransferase domain-containing protein [Clostridium gasigenes]|uniref:type VII toxin-antitoxin system MntA family adenylyltransferase antitoxin n=1 Tax=Clostridium gasigenes TaxID=94869 RepID=UPI0014382B46|nr:nucleotidyltransferase domain-containing protein [Clostridium gasigenes]NKF06675.1 nucleotidyltransferase domain-containing protein [Clostridium gasigenes]QSW20975.1 nucleotidyltransferase domain-containing protein [Clostridium gasigenes]
MLNGEFSLEFDKEEVVHKIKKYLYNKENIMSAYIFGSFDTEKFTDKSDIDIAILTDKDILYEEWSRIKSELEDIIGIPIDLNNINSLPEFIQVKVIEINKKIFVKDYVLEEEYLNKLNNWKQSEWELWKIL